MRKNVNYAEITCDFCGKVEHIKASQVLPEGWSTAEIPQSEWTFNKKYDLCPDCIKKLEDIIECLKKFEKVSNSIDEFVLKYNKTDLSERPTISEVSFLYPEYVFLCNEYTHDIEDYWKLRR